MKKKEKSYHMRWQDNASMASKGKHHHAFLKENRKEEMKNIENISAMNNHNSAIESKNVVNILNK